MSRKQNRRDFLGNLGKGALATFAGMGVGAGANAFAEEAAAPRPTVKASERVRLALVGCGGMGNRHLESLVAEKECEVVAVCDVHKERYASAAKFIHAKTERYPDTYQDYRRVLDRNDIDGVIVATPDHWHALLAIHTCQAWKDVYVEKPVSTTVVEGRAMLNAARRFGRIVQVGTQQRSLKLFQDAMGIVQGGKLGAITTAGAWVGVNEFSGLEKPGLPPEELDWDLWLGPAPKVPYSPERFGGFRAFHDYSNGELTNWGVHLLDVVQWGIGQDSPLNVQAAGGTFTRSNGADDYQTIAGLLEYKGCIVSWEQRHSNEMSGKAYGMKFLGTKGRLFMDRGSYIVEPETLGIPETKETGDAWIDVRSHHENFFDCIRTRKRPAADIEQAHKATVASLITAIALDCGRKLVWDGAAEKFIGDEQANRHLYRPYRAPWHL